MAEYVKVTSTNTGKSIDAKFVEQTAKYLKVWIEASDTVLTMNKSGSMWEGRALGLGFESDGKVFNK